jgi:membrane protein implicated in regulation of membrane protease activity
MLLVGAVLLAVFVLPAGWALPLILLAAVVEIGETLFWVWLSRRRGVQMGPETLIGATGEVVSACTPLGQVRVGGELWRARCEEGAEPGDRVRVRALSDLTLVVERAKIDT